MDLDRGEIYFIRERIGAGFTEFTKIGRVAQSDTRNSAKRTLEHQTGNPRSLEPVAVVRTALHTGVENALHREFASQRLPGGEWFRLDENTLARAIERCQALAATNESHVPAFEAAARFRELTQLESVAPPSDVALGWQRSGRLAQKGIRAIEKVFDGYKGYLMKMHDKGIDVRRYTSITTGNVTRTFDAAVLESRYLNLYEQYSIQVPEKRNELRIQGLADESVLADFLDGQISLASTQLSNLSPDFNLVENDLDAMHATYFSLRELHGIYESDKKIARAHLMELCGRAAGIESVCVWDVSPEATAVNKEGLKRDYPDEYNDCTSESEPFPKNVPVKGWVSLEDLG
jgi:hypothetical protein